MDPTAQTDDYSKRFAFISFLSPEVHKIVRKVWERVVAMMRDNDGSHDCEHVLRVAKSAHYIFENEFRLGKLYKADLLVCILGALLHDWADRKLLKRDETVDDKLFQLREFLEEELGEGGSSITNDVLFIAGNLSYSKRVSGTSSRPSTYEEFPEFFIVEDADYLDALGPVGEIRCAMVSGTRSRAIRNDQTPSFTDYLVSGRTARSTRGDVTYMDHFQHKVLLLPELMTTTTAQKIGRGLSISNQVHLLLTEAQLEGGSALENFLPDRLVENFTRLLGGKK